VAVIASVACGLSEARKSLAAAVAAAPAPAAAAAAAAATGHRAGGVFCLDGWIDGRQDGAQALLAKAPLDETAAASSVGAANEDAPLA